MALGKIKADTLEHSTAGSLDTSYVVQGSAKAWLSLDGTGTISITGSFNITSTVDDATGTYTANYTSNMSAVDYAVSGSLTNNSNVMHCVSTIAASSFTTIHRSYNNTLTDTKPLSSVDGDLA
jgi:hypothetical protein